jgi:hypothetical protein
VCASGHCYSSAHQRQPAEALPSCSAPQLHRPKSSLAHGTACTHQPLVPAVCSTELLPCRAVPQIQVMDPHASLVPFKIGKPPAAQRPGPDSSPRKRHSPVRSLAELASRTADNSGGLPGRLHATGISSTSTSTSTSSTCSSSRQAAAGAGAAVEPSGQPTLSRSASLCRGSFSGPLAVVSPKGMLAHDSKTGEPVPAFDAHASEIQVQADHSPTKATQHATSPATTSTLHSVNSTTPLAAQQALSDAAGGSNTAHDVNSTAGFGNAFRMCAAPQTNSAPLPCLLFGSKAQQQAGHAQQADTEMGIEPGHSNLAAGSVARSDQGGRGRPSGMASARCSLFTGMACNPGRPSSSRMGLGKGEQDD